MRTMRFLPEPGEPKVMKYVDWIRLMIDKMDAAEFGEEIWMPANVIVEIPDEFPPMVIQGYSTEDGDA